jgi:hypothetical protein
MIPRILRVSFGSRNDQDQKNRAPRFARPTETGLIPSLPASPVPVAKVGGGETWGGEVWTRLAASGIVGGS